MHTNYAFDAGYLFRVAEESSVYKC